MDDRSPVYAQLLADPVEAVLEAGGPFGLGWSKRVRLRQGEQELAVVECSQDTGVGGSDLARIEFGPRTFTLTTPPDRTLGEWLAECFSPCRRRRVWRAGSGIAAEIRNITQDRRTALRGAFERDGTPYVVERPVETSFLGRREGDGRIKAHGREVAQVRPSLETRRILLITPEQPLRLDVLAIAFELYMALTLPRGGGNGSGGAGGGGGDGGGGC